MRGLLVRNPSLFSLLANELKSLGLGLIETSIRGVDFDPGERAESARLGQLYCAQGRKT